MNRICTLCKKEKSIYEYCLDKRALCGRSLRCKECQRNYARGWYLKNIESQRIFRKQQKRKWKLELIKEYGGKCVCCGITEIDFLTIDHIYNDGGKERKTIPGHHLAFKLKQRGWPKDRYQLLCYNCNMAKQYANGCPHTKQIKIEVA